MPTLKYALISESFSVDQMSNTLSVFNIIEEINSPQFPAILHKICANVVYEKTEGEADTLPVQFLLRNNNVTLLSQTFDLEFRGNPRSRLNASIAGMAVQAPGTLTFTFTCNALVTEISIPVRNVNATAQSNS